MATHLTTDIAIIGAGVIGMTIAERLLQEGRAVVLIDPNTPGMGASYGNAGTVADYAVMPVGSPDVLRSLPSLLFNPNSPLAIRQAALPSLLPWLLRFARQSLPAAAAGNARAIAALLDRAAPLWTELAERLGAAPILQQKGCLYLYETRAAFEAGQRDIAFRQTLGISAEMLGPEEVARMEPNLPPVGGGAAFFPQAIFMSDPGRMVQSLASRIFRQAGLVTGKAERLTRQFDGVIVEGEGFRVHARTVIVAAGAHGRALAAQAGDAIPLDTERGYHVEWDLPAPLLNRPTCPVARGFYLCPMEGRLRVAGTVELGGLTAPPSRHRISKLVEGAQRMFPDLGPPDREWMGFRPSIPDSRPVIGPSRLGNDVIHAFGHGHIGMTLAPITAEVVSDLVARRPPALDIAPYRADRF